MLLLYVLGCEAQNGFQTFICLVPAVHDKKQNMSFNEVTALWVPDRKVFTGERLQEQGMGRG